jgi:uncharacterized protein (DUF1778 family)
MQLHHHVTQVAQQLSAAAALGDDRTKQIAAALAEASASAVRLALLAAVSEAADELTAALLDYPGAPAVTVRLEGDAIALDVQPTQSGEAGDGARDEGEASARITLRLTEALKGEIDAAAEREGVSVNTWLVRLAANAVRNPFAGGPFANIAGAFGAATAARAKGRRNDQHVTGWING